MNLCKLFELQNKLDKRIIIEHDLQNSNLLSKKTLALLVEIGELANETRCFKFWSTKNASAKEIILEEYVDCLHFILSIGLEKGYDDIIINEDDTITIDAATDHFLSVYNYIMDFMNRPCREEYTVVFKSFLALGFVLGFSEDEIENAYLEKNNVNHQRQDQGY